MMSPTQKKVLFIAIALLVIGMILLLLRRTTSVSEVKREQQAPVQTSKTPVSEMKIPLAPVTQEQVTAQKNRNMTTFSMQFAERFGSYSTEGNFQNLKDLEPSITSAMWRRIESTMQSGIVAQEFYGVTTKALAVKVESSGPNSARINVSTRRSETKGMSPARLYNQDVVLELVKSGEEWLVDSAEWITNP